MKPSANTFGVIEAPTDLLVGVSARSAMRKREIFKTLLPMPIEIIDRQCSGSKRQGNTGTILLINP
ncbi:MAG: hypothetical protein Ct9H300mP11_30960 [Chloroflexota bacterium]|nr:MAG: hypothetical protein Ct9H300mP11_30960 [Chloroflexota bacterium]